VRSFSPGEDTVEMIQISNRRTIRAASRRAFAGARTRFAQNGYLKLAALIEPGFLSEVTGALDRGEFYTRIHEGIGSELCASPSPLTGALELAFNDPVLFGLVDELTGCGAIGCFEGRVYRMVPSEAHYDSWHSDVGEDRLVALSVNLGREPAGGGRLQIRRADSSAIVAEVENRTPGDAVLFRIDPGYRHRVGPVLGASPRTAYAGWFRARPDYQTLLRERLGDENWYLQ
jgi:hypothetical protein